MTENTSSHPVALITGGSAGLGLTVAGLPGCPGLRLHPHRPRRARLAGAVAGLREQGGQAQGYPGDVGDPAHRQALVAAVAARAASTCC